MVRLRRGLIGSMVSCVFASAALAWLFIPASSRLPNGANTLEGAEELAEGSSAGILEEVLVEEGVCKS